MDEKHDDLSVQFRDMLIENIKLAKKQCKIDEIVIDSKIMTAFTIAYKEIFEQEQKEEDTKKIDYKDIIKHIPRPKIH